MACQALEVAIPVDGNEIRAAIPAAIPEKLLHPVEAGGGAGDGWRTELDAVFLLQRLDVCRPDLGGVRGRDIGAAGARTAVGFIERQHVRDVLPVLYQAFDLGEEGGVGGAAGGSAPKHGDELQLRAFEGRGRRCPVRVVPCEVGTGVVPDVIVGGVLVARDVDEAALGRRIDVLREDCREGREAGEEEGEE